ncbi:hypothetical protein [uncultured Fusobacterium sp.]|jgi:hypothetical protein|uniref:hypothetical protein n=1 Tax=uncultured Fusobacterium sp. TaxID=159267 RepID=UPI002597D442|nr:hypothetical protein [uncultured Fusobacterium sp.]
MAIEKTFNTKNFSYIEDNNLSWKATGLLTYLLKYNYNSNLLEHLTKVKTDGITSCKNVLIELRKNNYCHYFELRQKGKIITTFYVAYDVPTSVTDKLIEEIFLEINGIIINDKKIKIDKENFSLIYKNVI